MRRRTYTDDVDDDEPPTRRQRRGAAETKSEGKDFGSDYDSSDTDENEDADEDEDEDDDDDDDDDDDQEVAVDYRHQVQIWARNPHQTEYIRVLMQLYPNPTLMTDTAFQSLLDHDPRHPWRLEIVLRWQNYTPLPQHMESLLLAVPQAEVNHINQTLTLTRREVALYGLQSPVLPPHLTSAINVVTRMLELGTWPSPYACRLVAAKGWMQMVREFLQVGAAFTLGDISAAAAGGHHAVAQVLSAHVQPPTHTAPAAG